jgi:acetyltransferase-like isoleucine patch superfamily enzyme
MFNKLKKKLYYKFLSIFKPEMIGNPKRLSDNLGNKVGISNTTHISNRGENLKIGNNVFIGHFNYIDAFNASLTIGNNVQITNYCNILTHSTHNAIRFPNMDLKSQKCQETVENIGSIIIKDYTYIGPHSVIMPGTNLGKGCIVAAYSYVKGEFPDFCILRGQPAKIVGTTKDIDQELMNNFPELKDIHFYSQNAN